MTRRYRIEIPAHLSDESAAQVLDFLYAMSGVFESRYFSQIRRYHNALRAETMEASDAHPRPAAGPDTDSAF